MIEKETDTAEICLEMKKEAIVKLREISETLGLSQSEIISQAILHSKVIEIFEDAAKSMKAVKSRVS